jgi:hypothetical protein
MEYHEVEQQERRTLMSCQMDMFAPPAPAAVTPVTGLRVLWVALNPSTATHDVEDHTSLKFIGFTRRLANAPPCPSPVRGARLSDCGTYRYTLTRAGDGWGATICNLFGYRATDSAELARKASAGVDIIGPENDAVILAEADQADRIIVAWGAAVSYGPRAPAQIRGRDRHVLDLLKDRDLWCYGLAAGGEPRHPLMLSYSTPLVPFQRAS